MIEKIFKHKRIKLLVFITQFYLCINLIHGTDLRNLT